MLASLIELKKRKEEPSTARRSLAPRLALQLPAAIAMVNNKVPDQFLIPRPHNPCMPWKSPATRDQFDFCSARFTHFFATDRTMPQDVLIRSTILTSTAPTHHASWVDVAQTLFKTLQDKRRSKPPQNRVQDLYELTDIPNDTLSPHTPIINYIIQPASYGEGYP